MKKTTKVITTLALATLSISSFAQDIRKFTISGMIDKGLSANTVVTYQATNKFLPGCGEYEYDYLGIYFHRVSKFKNENFNSIINKDRSYTLETELRQDVYGICGWKIYSLSLNIPITPIPAGATESFATYELSTLNSLITEDLLDITEIVCSPRLSYYNGIDVWNNCKHEYELYASTSDLINFNLYSNEDRETKINIILKK
ncbi:MAG: hypothetical protein A2381_03755 [Bdellovibrionales bacterium RIFOXYB1_FULL_37_110]|nr:MAG: hypothetical protein A2417_16350 [Bdellovibrionales bacterium RIFOXYC1_FULL_37_79]OFZ59151.1 MAG: hypothetical protein A2381_03755 [Bdellovibrionales bacterium RIFOXYB1_FULL_37_110]OFZ64156.1 MAG: hypothetical protein A2577_14785 [Bdellovibrionales bacterium RIFOXYD1_FULL_36_51]